MTIEVIIIRETFWQSARKDFVAGTMLIVSTSIGWMLKIDALEWVGAVLFLMWVYGKSVEVGKTLTIGEARALLDAIEARTTDQGEAK